MRAEVFAKRVVPSRGVGFEVSQMFPNDRELLGRLILSLSTGQRTNA